MSDCCVVWYLERSIQELYRRKAMVECVLRKVVRWILGSRRFIEATRTSCVALVGVQCVSVMLSGGVSICEFT